MLKFVVRRLLAAIPLLLLVSIMIFLLVELIPGDPASVIAGTEANPELVKDIRTELRLDDPLVVRYGRWLGSAAHGDLGTSLTTSRANVFDSIRGRVPLTVSLAAISLLISLLVSIPLGIVAALRQGSRFDRGVTALASVSMASPGFVIGLFLVLLFAVRFAWFPATGYVSISDGGVYEWLRSLFLPAVALSSTSIGHFTRQTRGAFLDVLYEDYIRTARAKGLRQRAVLMKHAAKSAAIPVVTVVGLSASRLLGGAVTVEFVFALPGLGTLIVNAVSQRDIPMIQGAVLTTALFVTLVNLLVDLSYGLLNPKVRE